MSAQETLQTALVAALKADAGVAALVVDRVYDVPPARVAYPYISFGPSDELNADADLLESDDFTWQLDIWSSRGGNKIEARNIARAVRAALDGRDLDLGADALVHLDVSRVRIITDPDPSLAHGIVTLDGSIEHNG